MKEAIQEKAKEMYVKLGFKGVTLDDIAQEMAISKKTIYQHFSSRNELIEAVAKSIMQEIKDEIDNLCQGQYNPIEEFFVIRSYLRKTLEGKYQLPVFQLQKFYPEISYKIKQDQFCKMHDSIMINLKRGIEMGLYRPELDLEFITRIYFAGVTGTKDPNVFPEDQFNIHKLHTQYIEYHLRAIGTEKGLALLHKYLVETDENS